MADERTSDEAVVALEERFWLEGGGNPAFWEEHFADDGIVALPFGLMDKAQTVAAMGRAQPWRHVDMTDLQVVPAGAETTVVTYRASATRAQDGSDYGAVVGSVYARRDGAWKLLFHQQSPATDDR